MMRLRLLVSLVILASILLFGRLSFAQVGKVDIAIPRKGPNAGTNPYRPIGRVKVIISVSTRDPVTFTITPDAGGTAVTVPFFPAVKPGDPQPSDLSFSYSNITNKDTVSLHVPTNSTDPPIYELWLDPLSDYLAACTAVQPTRTFTISVAPTDPQITGVCVESFDVGPGGSCAPGNDPTRYIPIPKDNPLDTFAFVGITPPLLGCKDQRPPIDVVMVLDKSGSMISDTLSGITCPAPPCKRMDALHFAVNNFVDVWSRLPPAQDKIGAVLFSTNADWWQDSLTSGLHDLSGPSGVSAQITNNLSSTGCPTDPANCKCPSATNCGQLVPTFTTSIGAGLLKANDSINGLSSTSFVSDGRRHAILLMSDGLQNTDPIVNVNAQSQVVTSCPSDSAACSGLGVPAIPTPLANTPQIYTVTLGPSTGPAMVNQQIAVASHGFYLNTETKENLLGPFFLELLQNFLAQTSYETVRMISETSPYFKTVPISATSHDVEFSLMWPKNLGALRLTVTPPGGTQPIVKESASGFISIVQTLPLSGSFDPGVDWGVCVEAPSSAGKVNPPATDATCGMLASGNTGVVPFDLHVMTDDGALKSDLSVVAGDYKPGDSIKLRAMLSRFGRPILGLGPGQIIAQLVKPGASIGDILSDSKASATPTGPDPQTPAEAKLANTLKDNPSVLVQAPLEIVQLYDDGKPEHGDDVAGDGIYNALYPVTLPGHYNFLISAQNVGSGTVRFSRQQLRTTYVRAVLDKDSKTKSQSTVQPCTSSFTSLRGTLLDPQGAVIAGAIVTAINTVTGNKITTTTASDGSYQFAGLTPGPYQLVAPGAANIPSNSIQLLPGQNAIYNIRMIAGAAAQIINAGNANTCNNLVVTMTPKTKFGNRLGPGWANYLWLTTPNGTAFKPKDNLDGTYTATLNYVSKKSPDVSLHFENVIAIIGDSVTPDQLPQKLDGNNVVAQIPPPSPGKFAVFADLGVGIPNGAFGNAFNTGVSFNGGLEYILNAHIFVEGILGYHHFPGKGVGDVNVFQFTGGGKVYSSAFNNNFAFARAGLGGYHFSFSPGSTTNFGGYFGGGLLHQFGNWGLEGAYTFHAVNTPGVATKFSTVQGGIRWVF